MDSANNPRRLVERNLELATKFWGTLSDTTLETLSGLTRRFGLVVSAGDLILLDGKWYVTHAGLLGVARRSHCTGIQVRPALEFCNPAASRWAFEATVYKSRACRGFVGYGDADPSNVSLLVHGAEMRVAETRAVNRALRKAYGIGICSVEEIGCFAERPNSSREPKKLPPQPANGNHGAPKVRDRLCQIIRQHQLVDSSARVKTLGGLHGGVAANGEHVVRRPELDLARHVVTQAHIAVRMVAEMGAVDVNVTVLHDAVELDVDLLARQGPVECEMFSIPGYPRRRVAAPSRGRRRRGERIARRRGSLDSPVVRDAQRAPRRVCESRPSRPGWVTHGEQPAGVEREDRSDSVRYRDGARVRAAGCIVAGAPIPTATRARRAASRAGAPGGTAARRPATSPGSARGRRRHRGPPVWRASATASDREEGRCADRTERAQGQQSGRLREVQIVPRR